MSATSSPEWGIESDPPVTPSLVDRTLPGNLHILGRLGEISEGLLYRAEYPMGPEVVLAVLRRERNDRRPSDDSISLLRMQQKLKQAIHIKHPNVAAVYEVGETSEGLIYVVMEQLDGELLSNILAVRGAVSLDEGLNLCLQAAAGLQAAHTVGLAHGNLSPTTILITEAEGHARVKLVRFSPASFSTGEQGNRPIDKSATDYASPERLQGYPPDQKSDVFSLGAVLHHLLTGAAPEGSRLGAVPEAMRAVLTHALAPSPAQRFQTIAEFAGELERAAAVARRPKWTTANPFRSWRAAGVSLVVIVFAVLWLPRSLHRQQVGAVRPAAETVTRAPPAKNVGTSSIPQRTGRLEPVPRDSVSNRSGNGPPWAPLSRAPAAARQSSDSKAPPSQTGTRSGIDLSTPKADKLLTAGIRSGDSPREPQLSPFRRSHPWAAVPGQRFYFRSSCSVALRSTDLLYFKSLDEARAAGYVRSPVPGCH